MRAHRSVLALEGMAVCAGFSAISGVAALGGGGGTCSLGMVPNALLWPRWSGVGVRCDGGCCRLPVRGTVLGKVGSAGGLVQVGGVCWPAAEHTSQL
jgi:hypothetical protein